MNSRLWILVSAIVLPAAFAWAQAPAPREMPTDLKLEIKKTRLTDLERTFDPHSLVVSSDMTRAAYVCTVENQRRVVMNDQVVGTYKDVDGSTLRFSPDGKRLAFVACTGSSLLSATDINARTGRCHTLLTAPGGQVIVVCDGKRIVTLEAIDPHSLRFSPDGRHIVFIGRTGPVGWRLYVDGDAAPADYDDIACQATPPTIRYSADGAHMAYAAIRDGKWMVVADGRPGMAYDTILDDSIVFSPDGGRLAYAVMRGDRELVVVDRKEQPEFSKIVGSSLVFSPNGKRLGYLALRKDESGAFRCLAVIDGVPGRELTLDDAGTPRPDVIHPTGLRFSPDGSRYAWVLWNQHMKPAQETESDARAGSVAAIGAQVVVDSEVGPETRSILSDLCFSPDGTHLAYEEARGDSPPSRPYGDVRLVVDRKDGRSNYMMDYPSVEFSPDSRYVACIGVRSSGQYRYRLLVNNHEGPVYLNFVAAAPYGQTTTPLVAKKEIVFTGPRTFACAAYRHWSIVRLDVTIVEQ